MRTVGGAGAGRIAATARTTWHMGTSSSAGGWHLVIMHHALQCDSSQCRRCGASALAVAPPRPHPATHLSPRSAPSCPQPGDIHLPQQPPAVTAGHPIPIFFPSPFCHPPAASFHSQLPSVCLRCSSSALRSASNFLSAYRGNEQPVCSTHGETHGQAGLGLARGRNGGVARMRLHPGACSRPADVTASSHQATGINAHLSFHSFHAGCQLRLLRFFSVSLLPHFPQLCAAAASAAGATSAAARQGCMASARCAADWSRGAGSRDAFGAPTQICSSSGRKAT